METELLPRTSSPNEPKWKGEWKTASKEMEKNEIELANKPKSLLETLRVNQLDAFSLDAEINDVLSTQYMKMFEFFKSETVDKLKPELMALLDSLVYYFSIYSTGTTYGNKLQNLKFADATSLGTISTTQKIAFGAITIGGKWLWARLQTFTTPTTKLWYTLNSIEKFYRICSIFNFLMFLYDGRYVSIITRLLRISLIYHSKSVKRTVSFEYMNRQLVWHEFTEFLMFLIPLLNTGRFKKFLSSLFSSKVELSTLPITACPICTKDPVQTAYQANCGHLFCYYCLKQNCMIDSSFGCPRCGIVVNSMKRYQVEEPK